MSIYPVRLSEWFPPSDEMYPILLSIVNNTRCTACGKHPRYLGAVGHHSLPWGNGEIFCSWKCCRSGKVEKLDKRRERRLKRRYGKSLFAALNFFETNPEFDHLVGAVLHEKT